MLYFRNATGCMLQDFNWIYNTFIHVSGHSFRDLCIPSIHTVAIVCLNKGVTTCQDCSNSDGMWKELWLVNLGCLVDNEENIKEGEEGPSNPWKKILIVSNEMCTSSSFFDKSKITVETLSKWWPKINPVW